ncbi:MAG: CDP-diacylglycerol--glycerol-3-phosphate 3-phosphatidyltransferase [Planctomycetota bacterium]|jgi:CDP-diacylglycerol--glycerol-3-phosphate 3-phosphatidyltransferase
METADFTSPDRQAGLAPPPPGARIARGRFSGEPAILTLPNVLTLLRLLSAPLFLAVFFGLPDDFFAERTEVVRLALCLGLVIASEISDGLDGYFARKYKQVSDFGKLMDPYADSAFRLTVFFSFAGSVHKWVPLWTVVVLLYRDILTSVVRTFGMKRGVVIAARVSGKLKAISQAAAIISILVIALAHELGPSLPSFLSWIGVTGGTTRSVLASARPIMWMVLAIAVWSGIDYVWACRRHILAAAAPAGEGSEPDDPEEG